MKSDLRELQRVNWDFPDYLGTTTSGDLALIHWYPGSFIPQIPAALIELLTAPGDCVLDPFMGSGTTVIESMRGKRRSLGSDINPVAVDITKAKVLLLSLDEAWFAAERETILGLRTDPENERGLRSEHELTKWYHPDTLCEIMTLRDHALSGASDADGLVRKVLVSAILNKCVDSRPTYNHITDGCFPAQPRYIDAFATYREQIDLAERVVKNFRIRYERSRSFPWPGFDGELRQADARQLSWVSNNSVDLVMTSPPYLGVTDYVRSMRLHWLVFPNSDEGAAFDAEIGARRKRGRKRAYLEFMQDMSQACDEWARVVKPQGFVATVLGEGRGRVMKGEVINPLVNRLVDEHGFSLVFEASRRLSWTRVRVSSIDRERILVLQAPA